ncbi:histidine phosphatase family protein [Yoonia litorea]|uniref:Broad specificity phosphatase PhoE n=1 Tax=Yoonia litorea TaxID=1123755 RepID=A0A1I6L7T1_9RHOB|nr:histidine phosphatase family protein [Yoonia litorea]SFR99563.1 Broad specificity phosphatase PhoE [Yoonia litorea]
MTRLWLVRHGPTHAKSMVGWSDIPADLSDSDAIRRLRQYLPDAPVVSSDLIRAVETADALQPQNRLEHDRKLREINFGDWELKTFAEVEAKNPKHIRAYWETPGDIAPPNGESWNAVRDRVSGAIDGYLNLGLADLIIVAHFGAILTQVQRAKNITAYEAFGHRIENLSVTDLKFDGQGWHVGRINHVL